LAEALGRYIEYENVYDFIEIKLEQLANMAWHNGRNDVSEMLDEVREAYMLGAIDIIFVHGWPYTVEKAEVDNLNDIQ